MAWYITPNNLVLEYTCTRSRRGKDFIQLPNGMEIEADSSRLFAVHPDQNENLEKVDGVWYYQGKPLGS